MPPDERLLADPVRCVVCFEERPLGLMIRGTPPHWCPTIEDKNSDCLAAELAACQRAKQLDEHQIDILNGQCRRLWDALKSLAGLDDSQVEYIAHNDPRQEELAGEAPIMHMASVAPERTSTSLLPGTSTHCGCVCHETNPEPSMCCVHDG